MFLDGTRKLSVVSRTAAAAVAKPTGLPPDPLMRELHVEVPEDDDREAQARLAAVDDATTLEATAAAVRALKALPSVIVRPVLPVATTYAVTTVTTVARPVRTVRVRTPRARRRRTTTRCRSSGSDDDLPHDRVRVARFGEYVGMRLVPALNPPRPRRVAAAHGGT